MNRRPMPGPPERASHDRHSAAGFIRSDCPWCRSFRPDESKRLTDAECAAEYWRAVADRLEFDSDVNCGYETPDDTLDHRAEVWHRFKDTTHALEPAL